LLFRICCLYARDHHQQIYKRRWMLAMFLFQHPLSCWVWSMTFSHFRNGSHVHGGGRRVKYWIFECRHAKALVEAFLTTDIAFIKELVSYRKSNRCIQKDRHSSCTAIATIVSGNMPFVTNSGDCQAILCRAGNLIALSKVSC